MRLSDIKKKSVRPPVSETRAVPAPPPPSCARPAAKPPEPPPARQRAAAPQQQGARANLDARRAQAQAVYGRAIEQIRKVFAEDGHKPEGVLAELRATVDEMIAALQSGSQALLLQTNCSTPADEVCSHSVNTSVLALYLAGGMRLPAEHLTTLGLAALLHDLGRPRSYRLGLVSGLSAPEAWNIQQGIKDAAAALALFPDGDEELFSQLRPIILGLHTPLSADSASGAPDWKATFAQIVSLCDLFEALTHGWDGKPPVTAYFAFKTLLAQKSRFEPSILKRLIEMISPFPPGSLIQLADGRLACVVGINSGMITRPLVQVWLQSDGTAQDPPTLIDLSQELLVGVSGLADLKKPAAVTVAEKIRAYWLWQPA